MYDQPEKTEAQAARDAEARRKRKKRQNIIFAFGIVGFVIAAAAVVMAVLAINSSNRDRIARKPVLYLYPHTTTEVSVKLGFEGVTVTYPEYNGEWKVTAYPDGTLVDETGREYGYLFWEGELCADWDFSEGFCVKGSDTAEFLRRALSEQGLTPHEYNDFIVYWLPYMQDNPYNVISFQALPYEQAAPLEISPAPDSVKRVFMAYYAVDKEVAIPSQKLEGFDRYGFTAVEWGGVCLD